MNLLLTGLATGTQKTKDLEAHAVSHTQSSSFAHDSNQHSAFPVSYFSIQAEPQQGEIKAAKEWDMQAHRNIH